MISVLVALVLLVAGVAAIYLLLKDMSEAGIDIAAPGSCKRNRCGPSNCAPAEAAEEVHLQAPERETQDQARP